MEGLTTKTKPLVIYILAPFSKSLLPCFEMSFVQAKKLLGADDKQLGVSERLTAGAMAGVASQTSIYPLEVVFPYDV